MDGLSGNPNEKLLHAGGKQPPTDSIVELRGLPEGPLKELDDQFISQRALLKSLDSKNTTPRKSSAATTGATDHKTSAKTANTADAKFATSVEVKDINNLKKDILANLSSLVKAFCQKWRPDFKEPLPIPVVIKTSDNAQRETLVKLRADLPPLIMVEGRACRLRLIALQDAQVNGNDVSELFAAVVKFLPFMKTVNNASKIDDVETDFGLIKLDQQSLARIIAGELGKVLDKLTDPSVSDVEGLIKALKNYLVDDMNVFDAARLFGSETTILNLISGLVCDCRQQDAAVEHAQKLDWNLPSLEKRGEEVRAMEGASEQVSDYFVSMGEWTELAAVVHMHEALLAFNRQLPSPETFITWLSIGDELFTRGSELANSGEYNQYIEQIRLVLAEAGKYTRATFIPPALHKQLTVLDAKKDNDFDLGAALKEAVPKPKMVRKVELSYGALYRLNENLKNEVLELNNLTPIQRSWLACACVRFFTSVGVASGRLDKYLTQLNGDLRDQMKSEQKYFEDDGFGQLPDAKAVEPLSRNDLLFKLFLYKFSQAKQDGRYGDAVELFRKAYVRNFVSGCFSDQAVQPDNLKKIVEFHESFPKRACGDRACAKVRDYSGVTAFFVLSLLGFGVSYGVKVYRENYLHHEHKGAEWPDIITFGVSAILAVIAVWFYRKERRDRAQLETEVNDRMQNNFGEASAPSNTFG